MATWGETIGAGLPQAQRDRIAAGEAREAREWEALQVDRQDRAEVAARMSANYEANFQYNHGCTQAEWRDRLAKMAALQESRNPAAEYGSASRAEVMVTGAGGELVRMNPREQARPSSWTDPVGATLARAAEVRDNPFMARMVAEFDQRRGGKPLISRSETPETITCFGCIAENATVDEWLKLHHGDNPIPEETAEDYLDADAPDYAPTRSKRVRSGTGWPELVR
jgi:hypothetical protein